MLSPKKNLFSYLAAGALVIVLSTGCNTTEGDPDKTKDIPLKEEQVPTLETDSLPPIDSTATSRPETRKT